VIEAKTLARDRAALRVNLDFFRNFHAATLAHVFLAPRERFFVYVSSRLILRETSYSLRRGRHTRKRFREACRQQFRVIRVSEVEACVRRSSSMISSSQTHERGEEEVNDIEIAIRSFSSKAPG
jgi:hypothetical protein